MNDQKKITSRLDKISDQLDRLEKNFLEYSNNEGRVFEPDDLDAEWDIKDESMFIELLGEKDLEVARVQTKLVFRSWTYSWRCNWLNQCKTTYRGSVFIVNKANGRTLKHNLLQSASRKDHAINFWDTSPNSYVDRYDTDIRFGFGEENGRSCHVSSCANFFGDWGSVSWKWTGTAC